MRVIHFLFALFLFSGLVHAKDAKPTNLTPEEAQDGFVSLFDGKTLDGWRGSQWTVEDGVMACNGGHLAYVRREYANFVLRFEFKLTPGANNGLNFRSDGNIWNEIQIIDDSHPKCKELLHPYQYHGSLYGVAAAKRGFLKPVGQWNEQEVVADGSHIKVTLNGTVILDVDLNKLNLDKGLDGQPHPGLRRTKGQITWLGHKNIEEKEGPLWFRNIRIKELP